MIKTATISESGTYRYRLTRFWGGGDTFVTFIMLNPSTADADLDDPTIRRCIGFAQALGADGLEVVNLFALRSTDPKALLHHPNPVGANNDQFIRESFVNDHVIAAWGAHKAAGWRGAEVAAMAAEHRVRLRCFGLTKAHAPRHPLYVPASQPLEVWR